MSPPMVSSLYPRAWENRLPLSHPDIRLNRAKFFTAVLINFVLIVVLFFCIFCYLFGALFQQASRTHSLNILWVDYDDGIIGNAVRDAYKSLRSNTFPTLVERPVSQYPTPNDLWESVCHDHYWAALYTSPGSSNRLGLAIAGSATAQYNLSNVLSYIWNEAKYPTVMDSSISANLHTLSEAAQNAYIAINGSSAFTTIPPNDHAAIAIFTNPWVLTSYNIQPTTQGPRAVYNTLVIVLVLIQDFFYLGAINGLYVQFKIYAKITPWRIIMVRDIISGGFTMVGSLLLTCALWAFKDQWNVSGTQFVLTWLVLWLFAHVNFLTLDIFSIWIPPQFVPMALIAWVSLNITSIIQPFALSSPFYRWAYAMPAHQVYEVLTDIWSRGCNPHLYYALPILFVYEISGLIWTSLGVYRRCHYTVISEETAQEAMRMRVEAALKLEHECARNLERKPTEKGGDEDEGGDAGESSRVDTYEGGFGRETPSQGQLDAEEDLRHAERAVEDVDNEIQRMETRVSRVGNFGPSFSPIGFERE